MVASRSDSLSPSVVDSKGGTESVFLEAACILAITSPPRSLCPLNADGFDLTPQGASKVIHRTSSAAGTGKV